MQLVNRAHSRASQRVTYIPLLVRELHSHGPRNNWKYKNVNILEQVAGLQKCQDPYPFPVAPSCFSSPKVTYAYPA